MVSIIVPYAYDRGWLAQALESINAQQYAGPIEVVEVHRKKTLVDNINYGIKKSTGEFICYLCDDDMLTPNSIHDRVTLMSQGFDMVHGCAEELHDNGMVVPYVPLLTEPTFEDLLEENVIHGGTVMYRRECFERWGLFLKGLKTGEEYELNMRFLYNGARIGYVDSVLYIYRRHRLQKSCGNLSVHDKLWRMGEISKIKKIYYDKV